MTNIPFPQANNIDLIFSVLNDIGNDGLSKNDVSSKYNIDPRQGSYYLDALWYLGLVDKFNTKYFLSPKGIKTRLTPKDNMKGQFIEYILEHPFIGKLYSQCKSMTHEESISFIANSIFNTIGLSNSTSKRRASSIIKWFEWIDVNRI